MKLTAPFDLAVGVKVSVGVNVVLAVRPVSECVVTPAPLVAMSVQPVEPLRERSTWKPVSLVELSVHERLICEDEVAVAPRPRTRVGRPHAPSWRCAAATAVEIPAVVEQRGCIARGRRRRRRAPCVRGRAGVPADADAAPAFEAAVGRGAAPARLCRGGLGADHARVGPVPQGFAARDPARVRRARACRRRGAGRRAGPTRLRHRPGVGRGEGLLRRGPARAERPGRASRAGPPDRT